MGDFQLLKDPTPKG